MDQRLWGGAAELGQTSEPAVEETAAEETVATRDTAAPSEEDQALAGDTAETVEEDQALASATESPAEEAIGTQGATGDTAAPAEEATGGQEAPGTTDTPAEEAAQYYTVTLDANGGYFVNEYSAFPSPEPSLRQPCSPWSRQRKRTDHILTII